MKEDRREEEIRNAKGSTKITNRTKESGRTYLCKTEVKKSMGV